MATGATFVVSDVAGVLRRICILLTTVNQIQKIKAFLSSAHSSSDQVEQAEKLVKEIRHLHAAPKSCFDSSRQTRNCK